MKVLVIGSDGQLGSELKKISNNYNNVSWFFSSIKVLDLSDLNSINNYLSNINPTVILNCAAYTNVDQAETEIELVNIINYKAVDIISRWTSDNNKKLVHISTDYVFDGLSKLPLSENSNTNPINEYGNSKLKGEQVCLKNDTNSIIIRTSWLYSSFGNNFLKTMIELMKKNNSVKVVNDQIGSPTYAYDLAKVIIEIIMNNKNKALDNIMETVCLYYNVDEKDVLSKSRLFELVTARHMFCILARRHTSSSYIYIGKYINRNHATVIHGENKINTLYTVDKDTRRELNTLEMLIIGPAAYSSEINSVELKPNTQTKDVLAITWQDGTVTYRDSYNNTITNKIRLQNDINFEINK